MDFMFTIPERPLVYGIYDVTISNSKGGELEVTALMGTMSGADQATTVKLCELAANAPLLTVDLTRMKPCSESKRPNFYVNIRAVQAISESSEETPTTTGSEMHLESSVNNTDHRSDASCPICLTEYVNGEPVVQKSCCRKVWHLRCEQQYLHHWVTRSSPGLGSIPYFSCPMCRGDGRNIYGQVGAQGITFEETTVPDLADGQVARIPEETTVPDLADGRQFARIPAAFEQWQFFADLGPTTIIEEKGCPIQFPDKAAIATRSAISLLSKAQCTRWSTKFEFSLHDQNSGSLSVGGRKWKLLIADDVDLPGSGFAVLEGDLLQLREVFNWGDNVVATDGKHQVGSKSGSDE